MTQTWVSKLNVLWIHLLIPKSSGADFLSHVADRPNQLQVCTHERKGVQDFAFQRVVKGDTAFECFSCVFVITVSSPLKGSAAVRRLFKYLQKGSSYLIMATPQENYIPSGELT
jgi:hypothetical protein